ncbi:MAG: hypothetical protein KGQ61_11910 [Planctomycetes bacterium]|nr:hypothetical protein [Planctomycetota bacterium]
MRIPVARRLAVAMAVFGTLAGTSGCKTLNERYIALEVWKYERCFGHLPPGFVPPGAGAQPMRPCGQGAPCAAAPAAEGCDQCHGSVVEGGLPAGTRVVPDLPPGPGGAPTPLPAPAGTMPAPVSAGRPVVISDEVVLP